MVSHKCAPSLPKEENCSQKGGLQGVTLVAEYTIERVMDGAVEDIKNFAKQDIRLAEVLDKKVQQ